MCRAMPCVARGLRIPPRIRGRWGRRVASQQQRGFRSYPRSHFHYHLHPILNSENSSRKIELFHYSNR